MKAGRGKVLIQDGMLEVELYWFLGICPISSTNLERLRGPGLIYILVPPNALYNENSDLMSLN